jgi:putative endonuclease
MFQSIKFRFYFMKQCFVYILTSQRNGTLYVGSTTHLKQRIWQHKNNIILGFTSKYSVHQLVYYEEHENIMKMACREIRLKNWCRKWKLNLIEQFNPTWRDLYEEISG